MLHGLIPVSEENTRKNQSCLDVRLVEFETSFKEHGAAGEVCLVSETKRTKKLLHAMSHSLT